MGERGWDVGVEDTTEGDSITDLPVFSHPFYHVVVPRKDAVGALTPRMSSHCDHGARWVYQPKTALSIMKSDSGTATQSQRMNRVVKNNRILVWGELEGRGIADGYDIVGRGVGVPFR